MDNDSFTEVSSENIFSRLGDSFKGILTGILLFLAAFPILWMNEGSSVERYNSLKEGLGAVISVPSNKIDAANNSKLVHTQGLADTKEVLQDEVFGVSATAIKLERQVSMYQWKENTQKETKEKIGGTKETITTYTYSQDWNSSQINSSSFKKPTGHTNPSMAYQAKTIQAKKVTLGAFKLNPSQISGISGVTVVSLSGIKAPATLNNKKVTVSNDTFYIGNNSDSPAIGDMKISFTLVKPTDISVVAQQQSDSFGAYQTKAGGTVSLLKSGLVGADLMFAAAQKENTIKTWGIRIVGFIMMWSGLGLIFKPLAVIGSVLPFLGNLISMGTSILTFLLALPFAMITIALAWIAYRPILAGSLIAIAVIAIVLMKFMPRKNLAPAEA